MLTLLRRIRMIALLASWLTATAAVLCFTAPSASCWARAVARDTVDLALSVQPAGNGGAGWRIAHLGAVHGTALPAPGAAIAPPELGRDVTKR